MKELKLKKIWLAIGLVAVGAIWYLSLMHSPPEIINEVPMEDKGSHFFGYLAVSFWFFQIYEPHYFKFVTLSFIVMGVLIEFIQGSLGYRSFEYFDMVANSIGVVAAWIIASFLTHQLLIKLETRLK